MATIETRERGGQLAGGARIPVAERVWRRDELELLGLLLGMLGILLVLSLTLGGAPWV